ncbi:uncharacterized protein [Clytia hemisphaerica]|uniref:Chitin-binding type-2 domain-containing protein n=1 Tax=Clytia hemisphaerica TaxID=252671 RepID=A0A7M5UXY4_9CNID
MEALKLMAFFALAIVLTEGKPAFTTQPTRARVTEACVSLDECGVFGGTKVGNFRHPDNSNWFYTCFEDNRQPECQQCSAPNLHFINKCNMCLRESDETKVTCPTVVATVTDTVAPVTCDTTFCTTQTDGMFAVLNDKTKFYHCSNKITYCKQCQAGLEYDDSCKACVDPNNHTAKPDPAN